MIHFKQTALLSVITLISTAVIAEAPMKEMAMPAAALHNWTGFFAGLNAGAVNHTMNITDNDAASFNATIQQVSNPGFSGGFQLGYRRQVDLNPISGVYGLEASGNYSNTTFQKQYGSAFALYQLDSQNELNSLYFLELIGGIAADKTLLFLAAGLSWSRITGTTTNLEDVPFFNSFKVNKTAFGTALGGGIEYAFTNSISARFKMDVIMPNTYTAFDDNGNYYQISNNAVQGTFGINYKFG